MKKPLPTGRGFYGAGNETRTRYLHLGKVALYRMSYARTRNEINNTTLFGFVKHYLSRFSLLLIVADVAEAFTENILGIGDYKEGVFVYILYYLSDIGYLRALDDA